MKFISRFLTVVIFLLLQMQETNALTLSSTTVLKTFSDVAFVSNKIVSESSTREAFKKYFTNTLTSNTENSEIIDEINFERNDTKSHSAITKEYTYLSLYKKIIFIKTLNCFTNAAALSKQPPLYILYHSWKSYLYA
ncbi:MAG: hypothetical protein IT239_00485 [Bacteroidia bacterium]|nr:hypothetical protein [Bacteroidia bacterium]